MINVRKKKTYMVTGQRCSLTFTTVTNSQSLILYEVCHELPNSGMGLGFVMNELRRFEKKLLTWVLVFIGSIRKLRSRDLGDEIDHPRSALKTARVIKKQRVL